MSRVIDSTHADTIEIDALASAFFDVFDNRGGRPADVDRLRTICIVEALFVKAVDGAQEACGLDPFIAPRERLLNAGMLVGFHEQELSARTEIFGSIAQRWCRYRKAGVLAGVAFETEGMKGLQFLRTPLGWRICAVARDDATG